MKKRFLTAMIASTVLATSLCATSVGAEESASATTQVIYTEPTPVYEETYSVFTTDATYDGASTNANARNISFTDSVTIKAGGSAFKKEFNFSGSLGAPDHNRATISIQNFSGSKYSISLTDETTGQVVVNGEIRTSDHTFALLGHADHKYKLLIGNPGADSISFDITITSYYQ